VVLGITGLPGSGKSSFAKGFEEYGALIIDADVIGHGVLKNDGVKKVLVERYSRDILVGDEINRSALASKVFTSSEEMMFLNSISHPSIYREIVQLIKPLEQAFRYAVVDAALLFEAGLNELCHMTIHLSTPFDIRVERVARRGWSKDELKKRDEHQDAALKQSRSNLCLNGDESEKHLKSWHKTLDIVLRYAMALGKPDQAPQLLQSWKKPLLLA
jgi:dephospho-CoA kinase